MNTDESKPEVFLLDDEPSVRQALSRALTAEGFRVRCWESANAFLADYDSEAPGCLVTDIAMPGLDGLELQRQLSARGCSLPVVFITGRGSIPMTVRAMRAGAVSFLPKPVRLAELATAIREALERDASIRDERRRRASVKTRLAALTTREREVLELVVTGKLNKQIAAQLGAAEKTIKVHRGRVMMKMQARSVAELVTMTHEYLR